MKKNTKIYLPYWLAKQLAVRNMVQIEIPKKYSTKSLKEIESAPENADLCILFLKQAGYFYEFGYKLGGLLDDDLINSVLAKTLTKRFVKILYSSQATRKNEETLFTSKLSNFELEVFEKARKEFENFENWKKHVGISKLKSSSIIDEQKRTKKKKRFE
jgi:GINS complex subunit 3